MSQWTSFVVHGDSETSYWLPIWKAAKPYAVVTWVAKDEYQVASADCNLTARVVAEEAQSSGATGIRIYLRDGVCFGQAHYFGGADEEARDWATHADCLAEIQEATAARIHGWKR